ncbi:hypothetical protein MRX96_010001 [Rhipicephalus microplus]
MGTLWFRFHNAVAQRMCQRFGTLNAGSNNSSSLKLWNEERIFNEARKLVIAVHQHIIMNDWLPEWLGSPLDEYNGWDSSIDPGIATEFQSAAMRFGHTLVTSGGYRRGYASDCTVRNVSFEMDGQRHSVSGVRTCNSFWNPPGSSRAWPERIFGCRLRFAFAKNSCFLLSISDSFGCKVGSVYRQMGWCNI